MEHQQRSPEGQSPYRKTGYDAILIQSSTNEMCPFLGFMNWNRPLLSRRQVHCGGPAPTPRPHISLCCWTAVYVYMCVWGGVPRYLWHMKLWDAEEVRPHLGKPHCSKATGTCSSCRARALSVPHGSCSDPDRLATFLPTHFWGVKPTTVCLATMWKRKTTSPFFFSLPATRTVTAVI